MGGTSLSAAKAAVEIGLGTDCFGFLTSSKNALNDVWFRQKEMKFCTSLSRDVESPFFGMNGDVVWVATRFCKSKKSLLPSFEI
jgi:hypothetical protein